MNTYEITLKDANRETIEAKVRAVGVLQAMRRVIADAIYKGHRNPKVIMIRESE